MVLDKFKASPTSRQSSNEKTFKYVTARIKTRRKTNPDNERLYKFTFSSRKKIVPKFSQQKFETPKATNCSSRLSSQNESKKENMGINTKILQNSHNHLSTNLKQKNTVFSSRKNSTQAKKMHKILLSPTNRTLLKPRKTHNKMGLSSKGIQIIQNQGRKDVI